MSEQNTVLVPEKSDDKKMIFAMATIGIICAFLIDRKSVV